MIMMIMMMIMMMMMEIMNLVLDFDKTPYGLFRLIPRRQIY